MPRLQQNTVEPLLSDAERQIADRMMKYWESSHPVMKAAAVDYARRRQDQQLPLGVKPATMANYSEEVQTGWLENTPQASPVRAGFYEDCFSSENACHFEDPEIAPAEMNRVVAYAAENGINLDDAGFARCLRAIRQ